MIVLKKGMTALYVLVAILLTMFSSKVLASNLILIKKDIQVTEAILADKPEAGYQYFVRFNRHSGTDPQCNIHVVSKLGPAVIPAGTILNSTEGVIYQDDNGPKHPLDFSASSSGYIKSDTVNGVDLTIRCTDSKSILAKWLLQVFDRHGINEFVHPMVEVQ